MPEFESDAARYRYDRDVWRMQARFDLGVEAEAADLRNELDEYVAHLMFELSGVVWPPGNKSDYLIYLLVTFARSHMIASDLIAGADLIDGAVILRRQMEVMSRLYEVGEAPDIATLLQRTPNVRNLRSNLRRLYGSYSAIAHASDPRNGDLLGNGVNSDLVALYPRFTKNAYVALQHLGLLVIELWTWLEEHAEVLQLPVDQDWGQEWLERTAPLLVAVSDLAGDA